MLVVLAKLLERGNAQFVVGLAEDEAQDEIVLCIVEHAVVERKVFTRMQVVDTQGRMSVQTVDLLVR